MAGRLGGARSSTHLLLFYYVAFSVGLLAESQLRPKYNPDMVAYIACAKSYEIRDESRLYSSVYRELEQAVDPLTFKRLTSDTHNRRIVSKDMAAFSEQLSFFKIRPVYNYCIYLLSKAGVNIVRASHLVSGIAVFIGVWLLFLIARPRIGCLYMYLLPPLGLALGLLDIASLSTPDGMAFLVVVLSVYLFLKRNRLLYLLLPVCVAVRTDLAVFVAVFAVYLLVFRAYRTLWTVVSLAVSVFVYFFINYHYGNPGWAVIFYYTLINKVSHPVSGNVELTAADYVKVLLRGLRSSVRDKPFLVYLCSAVASFYLLIRARAHRRGASIPDGDMYALFLIPLSYFVLHFVFFPDLDHRYFVPQYVVGAVALFWIMSTSGVEAAATVKGGNGVE